MSRSEIFRKAANDKVLINVVAMEMVSHIRKGAEDYEKALIEALKAMADYLENQF